MQQEPTIEWDESGLVVHFGGDLDRAFNWRWFQDHCEDHTSLNPDTLQRKVNTFAIDANTAPSEVELRQSEVGVHWPDGTKSVISLQTLRTLSSAPQEDARQPWDAESLRRRLTRAPFSELLNSETERSRCLSALIHDGVLLVDEVGSDLAHTRQLLDTFGGIRPSVFGEVWRVDAGTNDHADSSYTREELEPHSDGTYSHDAPAIEVLHFVRPANVGGQTVLVDGLAVVDHLREKHPDLLETLQTVSVTGYFVEEGAHLRAARPPVRMDGAGHLLQLTFNNYDRAPMWLQPDEMDDFYEAYTTLHSVIMEKSMGLEIKVEAGQAVVFDNWRVLHGRRSFDGPRSFQGGYVSREDFESQCRVTLPGSA